MTVAPFRPGNRLTEERLNQGMLIGRLVARLHRQTAQSISSSAAPQVADAIVWEERELDLLNGWDDSVNPSQFVPTVPGWYEFTGLIGYTSDTGNRRGAMFAVNGSLTGITGAHVTIAPSGGFQSVISGIPAATATVFMNGSTDYVQLLGHQSTGDPLNTSTTTRFMPTMSVKYVGWY